LYRRNVGNGTWIVKAPAGNGGYWTKRIAEADDYAEAAGSEILTYFAAQDRAKTLARGGDSETASSDAPGSEALATYAEIWRPATPIRATPAARASTCRPACWRRRSRR
jgi:hypothetical protein